MERAIDEIMSDEEKLQSAIGIAIQSGHLRRCATHGYVYSIGDYDYSDAYHLGEYLMNRKEPSMKIFEGDRRAMVEKIREAIDSHRGDCPGCEMEAVA